MKEKTVAGPFCRIAFKEMNLNSSSQIKTYLLAHGWVPDTYNYKKDKNKGLVRDENGEPIPTSPKLTESSFHTVKGEVPSLIARRNILMHRKRMLKNIRKTDDEETGLINLVRDDGRIGAGALPNATNTARMRHFNIVNIPGSGAVYGDELRDLFTTKEGYLFLGVDAAALEARCFAHAIYPYPGGKELASLLLEGDIHQHNADLWGCSRKEAKSPMYAILYGAQIPKLAATMGVSIAKATEVYDTFWETYTPLLLLRDALVKAWKSRGGKRGGYIKGIDGRKLFARSEHSLVNLYFQATGSIAVKVAALFADKGVKERELDCHQIIFYHDELDYEVLESHGEEAKTVVENSFTQAGKFLGLNVPLVGTGKLGKTWYECH